jgi:Flp pilus assembly protein TadG
MALVMAAGQTALMLFAGQTLELAVADSSRLILTGQAQSLDYNAFKKEVCARIYAMFDCANGIQLDVRTASTFTGADLSKPLDAAGNLNISPTFNPGAPGDIVVVRVVYKWPVWAQFGGISLIDMAGANKLLMSTAVFRNEP